VDVRAQQEPGVAVVAPVVIFWFFALWFAALAGIAIPIALTTLRVLRMWRWGGLRGPRDLMRAFVVAGTYDLARAVALLARARHHQTPATTSSPAATS